MKFDPKYRPELCASTLGYRQHLHYVYLDVKAKRLVGTDGHRLVCVPCQPERGDRSGAITAEALKLARREAQKGADARISAKGKNLNVGDVKLERPKIVDAGFPPYQKVLRDEAKRRGKAPRSAFSAELLVGIQKALGAKSVRLEFGAGPLDAITITDPMSTADAIALLMPVATEVSR